MASDKGSTALFPKTISDILTEVGMAHDPSRKVSKLEFYVKSLEEEMNKIDAFKRELPYCMDLLKEAIECLRMEMMKCKKGKEIGRPIMEEFIPLKGEDCGKEGRAKWSNEMMERRNWMSCVQLWSTPIHYDTTTNQDHHPILTLKPRVEEDDGKFSGGCNNFKNMGVGAFVPFKKQTSSIEGGSNPMDGDGDGDGDDGLSLSIPVSQVESLDLNLKQATIRPRPPQPNSQRKQRRCWSPDLHKRFVDALQLLGGPQNATPKQIRELMKVEGLTNDEVKSHLQKYRLHIRKLPGSLAGAMDYSWLTGYNRHRQDDLSKRVAGSSSSPQDHMQGSLARVGSASMDEDEDVKSESHSWKGRNALGI